MRTKQIEIDSISIDGDTQVRVELDTGATLEYQEAYKAGADLPPLVVFYDGSHYWLADGFHRYHGARSAFLQKMPCEVHNGTVDDARLYAAGANQSHGVRRTNADKRRAVEMCLNNPKSKEWSDRKIAEHVGVGDQMVATVRDQLRESRSSKEPEKRLGRDGKRRKVKPKKRRRQIAVTSDPEPFDGSVAVADDEPDDEPDDLDDEPEQPPAKDDPTPYRNAVALLRKAFEICPANLWQAALNEAAEW